MNHHTLKIIIIRTFSICNASLAAPLDISNALDRVWHTGLLCTFLPYDISGKLFYLVSSFSGSENLCCFGWKTSAEFSVNAGLPQSYFLNPTLFLLYISDLADDIAIYANDTTL